MREGTDGLLVDDPVDRRPLLRRRVHRHVVLAAFLALAVIVGGVVFVSQQGNDAEYQAVVQDTTPLRSSWVIVDFEVKNLGPRQDATPTCLVELASSDNSVTRTTSFRAEHPVPKGEWATYRVLVDMQANSASSIAYGRANVSCH